MHKISSSQTGVNKKSSYKYFVTYDIDFTKIHFQNTLDGDNDIENSNLKDSNAENLYAKLAHFIKTHIFEKLTVYHLPCYSIYKRKNLIFYGETTTRGRILQILAGRSFCCNLAMAEKKLCQGYVCCLLICAM